VIARGLQKGQVMILKHRSVPVWTLGRGNSCALQLNDSTLSNLHAELYHENGCWHIRDKDSRNGVLVNGKKISECEIKHQDVIECGEVAVIFQISKLAS
jgi:pSer/pThr/pTyr-binding forkhead associated (FHA) protein